MNKLDLTDIGISIQCGPVKDEYLTTEEPRTAFFNHLKSLGYKPQGQIAIGSIMRMDDPTDKKGKESGWAIYFEMPDLNRPNCYIGFGTYGSWRADTKENWSSKKSHFLTNQEREFYDEQIKAAEKARREEQAINHAKAAEKAKEIWSNAESVLNHEYLANKGIEGKNVKVLKDALIVPVYDSGEIVNVQRIWADGKKRFLKGGKKKGCYGFINGNDNNVYICEGYSTAASIHMATGCKVYFSFDAGNLFNVCTYVKKQYSSVTICGDDDFTNDINVGRNKATDAADALNLPVVFPSGHNDFNDMMAADGLESLSAVLSNDNKAEYYEPKEKNQYNVIKPIGIMQDIVDHYMFTSGKHQEGFAIQTALAALSVMLGRDFKTTFENYTSLYFINIGHSGAGKDHCKKYIERMFYELDCDHLICGDGFTSTGAVITTLEQQPKCISIIDEFGRYMKSVNDNGMSHMRQAVTFLMQCITKLDSFVRSQTYSQATVQKSKRQEVNAKVERPALSLLCLTTPDVFFDSVNYEAVKDGLFNRFIVYVDESPIEKRQHRPWIETPDTIKDWHSKIIDRISDEPVTLQFTDEAVNLFDAYGEDCANWANELLKIQLSEMPMRACEWAMRLSLIAALSENPEAETIEKRHAEWGIEYMQENLKYIIGQVKGKLYISQYEKDKMAFLKAIRDAGKNGVRKSDMNKKKPFSSIKPKDRKEILDDLLSGDLVVEEKATTYERGQPPIVYRALK